MMKRIASLLLCLVLLVLACPLTAQADVIYEPEDSFYRNNYESCTYVNRAYTANGPDGSVTIYKSPVSAKVLWTISNGSAIAVSYSYTDADGTVWALCEDYDNDRRGWAPMDYLNVIYDNVSFWEEYGETFLDEEGQLDSKFAGETIWFWRYPGSPDGIDHVIGEYEEYFPTYDSIYVDEDGRSWAYIMYYFGVRQVWICLDDPTADYDTLFPDGAPLVATTVPADEPRPDVTIVPKESTSAKIFTAVAVVLLVVVTAVMLTKMKKKEK